MQISEAAAGAGGPGAGADAEPCRFPKLEECAHFHYERVQLPQLTVKLQTGMDSSLHSQHASTEDADVEWFVVQVTSGDACWIVQRSFDNFRMLDDQLHRCIFDRKISQLEDMADVSADEEDLEDRLTVYLERLSGIADNSVNCGPVLNWLQMDNRGRRLLVPSEESRSINTPAVAAAYSVRRYVSQARDELNLEVGDMISVIDMASPGESMWWRGKRGFQVGFFPQHCVHIIGDKVPRNMPLPPPVVGSLALAPIKPVLRKHGKLIAFFRSFILNRPSRRRLKQSGILKERVFGCDLGEHLLNSRRDVPTVLECCADFIESKGVVDGIYRLSGVTSNIQKLRNAFDEDRIPNLYTEDIIQDIHSVASLLKMYFRELPNPLCTYQLYQNFVNAVQGCGTAIRNSETDHQRLLKMREAVQKLPPPHYRTLEYLMRHLARVAKHGTRTGMTTRNVAIVWAPNLLRCEALEVGGVAALQGVGVQAVVTEFLICYADLIFCDHLPNLDRPSASETLLMRKCRPNSLAIATPTKLITLEEARSKHLPHKIEECNYIEVGGGPDNLPEKYHTVIDLPPGTRKRGHTKRSPLGWRLFFSKSRNTSQSNLSKNRKSTTPITINEKSVTESDLTDMKRKLRSVKSAESLTSGHSEPASTEDVLGPLCSLNKPPGHNRSVSHDSYFDMLQNSQNNSEGSLLDLSEIQLNFDLEESEMRIFSEDESLVSSPRIQKEAQRRILTRARQEEYSSATNSVDPSPKKQPRVVLSPESQSRKRTRLEDQLSDIQYIDCNTPDNVVVSTTAVIHSFPESPVVQKNKELFESYQPKNKSPRNSDNSVDKRQSLNLEASARPAVPKSLTELDLNQKYLAPNSLLTTPTPGSPGYKQLGESSTNTTPDYPPGEVDSCKDSHNYENVLMTINITYRSPSQSTPTSPVKTPVSNIYENVILNPEKVSIPTSTASLPIQAASQPRILPNEAHRQAQTGERPKSLSALEDLTANDSTIKANLSSSAICNTSEQSLGSLNDQKTLSSNRSSSSNVQYTPSVSSAPYHCIASSDRLSASDLSLSEVAESSHSTTSRTSISFPAGASKDSDSPNVSATQVYDCCSCEGLTTSDGLSLENIDNLPTDCASWANDGGNLIDFSPDRGSSNDKRKSEESEGASDAAVYQQVKYFRRSIHEVNAMVESGDGESAGDGDREHVYEDVLVRSGEEVNRNCDQKEVSETVQEAQTKNVAIEDNYDSLEPENQHIYENLDDDDAVETTDYEDVDVDRDKTESPTQSVDESKQEAPRLEIVPRSETTAEKPQDELTAETNDSEDSITISSTNKGDSFRLRKFYEKDGLPPCLRARNLKHRLKTRSLDEEEFEKEFAVRSCKTNSLPKTLNAPKAVPGEDGRARTAHLAHSAENIGSEASEEEEQKKRERIEKYKEERRKILQDKYRSESFKENKEVLLTRLRIFKQKDEQPAEPAPPSEPKVDSEPGETARKEPKPMTESLKSRAAMFEPKVAPSAASKRSSGKPADGGIENREEADDLQDLDFIRTKRRDGDFVRERRRHTFDTRDRDSDAERLRRISLESRSPRKEKTSPTYCIKDMKAIFESKSKQ